MQTEAAEKERERKRGINTADMQQQNSIMFALMMPLWLQRLVPRSCWCRKTQYASYAPYQEGKQWGELVFTAQCMCGSKNSSTSASNVSTSAKFKGAVLSVFQTHNPQILLKEIQTLEIGPLSL